MVIINKDGGKIWNLPKNMFHSFFLAFFLEDLY